MHTHGVVAYDYTSMQASMITHACKHWIWLHTHASTHTCVRARMCVYVYENTTNWEFTWKIFLNPRLSWSELSNNLTTSPRSGSRPPVSIFIDSEASNFSMLSFWKACFVAGCASVSQTVAPQCRRIWNSIYWNAWSSCARIARFNTCWPCRGKCIRQGP